MPHNEPEGKGRARPVPAAVPVSRIPGVREAAETLNSRRLCVELLDVASLPQEGGSRATEPGSSGLPTAERHGGPQHAGEAGAAQVSQANVPPDPHGTARGRLLEAQSRSENSNSRRDADSQRRRRMSGHELVAPASPCGATPDERIRA